MEEYGIPAALVGGFLWEMDPRLPFVMALFVDGFIRLPILVYKIPETLIAHSHHHPAGPHIILYGLPGSGKTSIARLIQKELSLEVIDESIFGRKEQPFPSISLPFFSGSENKRKIRFHLSK